MEELLCGYWVSKGPDDPDGHVCGKDAVVVAQPNAPHLHEAGEDRAFCHAHSTERRLKHLMETGWRLVWVS